MGFTILVLLPTLFQHLKVTRNHDKTQQFNKNMLFWCTCFYLTSTTTCISFYLYNYNQNASTQLDYKPRSSLGSLTSGDTLTFILQFATDTGSSPTAYTINLEDSALTQITPSPAGFNTDTIIPAVLTTTLTWTVGDGGLYYVYFGKGAGPISSFRRIYLTVTHSNGTELVKYVDVLRSNLIKYFYVATLQTVEITAEAMQSGIYVYNMNSDPNNLTLTTPARSPTATSTQKQFHFLFPGFYGIQMTSPNIGTLNYSSDSYDCPYDITFPDPWEIFKPCHAPVIPSTSALGRSGSGSSSNSSSSIGSSSSSGTEVDAGSEGILAWQIVLIALGAVGFLIIVLIVVLKVRSSRGLSVSGADSSSANVSMQKGSNQSRLEVTNLDPA